jgi:D-3-phosphoglycerate dehydrogenase / 2-oxoglutarate reductase
VFPIKPSAQGDPFESELQGLANVILTPQVDGSTQEAQEDIGRFVADKVRDYVATGSSVLSVNLPQTRLQGGTGSHRLAHLHANTPGVLATVNSVLAQHNVNIEGQALATRARLGYLLTDVGTDYAPDFFQALNAMPETVRLRVLS